MLTVFFGDTYFGLLTTGPRVCRAQASYSVYLLRQEIFSQLCCQHHPNGIFARAGTTASKAVFLRHCTALLDKQPMRQNRSS